MFVYKSISSFVVLAMLSLLLFACGGSGGDKDDVNPDSFAFDDETNVPLAEYVISDAIEISGINTESPISIIGGEYSINGAGFTDNEGEVVDGDKVYVRVLSADTLNTETEATLSVGDKDDTFTVETVFVSIRARDSFKGLIFTWPSVEGADYYRLLQKPRAGDDFIQLGRDLDATATGLNMEQAIHRLDWLNTEYKLETCTNAECSSTDAISVYSYMRRAIGYFKSSNPEALDRFGKIALSADGNTLAVGAPGEDGASRGINGDDGNNALSGAGAVYVYVKDDGVWRFQAYLKASNADEADAFGSALALSGDGNTLAVGAPYEDSISRGVDGMQFDNDAEDSGAVYVFRRNGDIWLQQNYLKAHNAQGQDGFGKSIAMSSGGGTLAIAALGEDGEGSIVDPEVDNDLASNSGAVYVFSLQGDNWEQQSYIKAPNSRANIEFGNSLAISANGNALVIGAEKEQSTGIGIDPVGEFDTAAQVGAAYVYQRVAGLWQFQTLIKSSNGAENQRFARSVAISLDATTIAIGAVGEASVAIGTNGDQSDISNPESGAVYLFKATDSTWVQEAYVKASNGDIGDLFGESVALNSTGTVLAVGAIGESGSAEGVSGNASDNAMVDAGAVFVFEKTGIQWVQIKYVKAPNTDEGDAFGAQVVLDGSGNTLAVSAPEESGASSLFTNTQSSNSEDSAGAVYLY